IPFGIGGLGEIEFIRNNPTMGENVVLYHGITNLLRYGDVSLINVRTFDVAAIAELKTKVAKEHEDKLELAVSCTLVSNRRLPIGVDWSRIDNNARSE